VIYTVRKGSRWDHVGLHDPYSPGQKAVSDQVYVLVTMMNAAPTPAVGSLINLIMDAKPGVLHPSANTKNGQQPPALLTGNMISHTRHIC
jgi:hypothetical protein